jgi:hypothetical protein
MDVRRLCVDERIICKKKLVCKTKIKLAVKNVCAKRSNCLLNELVCANDRDILHIEVFVPK